jgi:succinoglycan biosynthesis protein ExoA
MTLRVLVLSAYPPGGGGGELQTQLQVAALARHGHVVEVVDLRGRDSGPSWETVDGTRVRRIRRPSWPIVAGLVFHARLAVHLLRRGRRFDVAHINHLGSAAITAGAVLGVQRVPRLLVLWGSSRQGIGPFARTRRLAWARRMARRFERVVALASGSVENLKAAGFDAGRIVYIPNGIDPERFRPREGPSPGTEVVVAAVGRLVAAKGLDVLLRAWARVSRTSPRARLHLIGDGPLRAELERTVGELDLPRVTFVGSVNDVPDRLRGADVYVSASRTEGMSNAIVEAMGAGLPIVATRVGGATDLIEHGRHGLLIAAEDEGALAEALLELTEDPGLRERLGRAARDRAVAEFSVDAVVRRYEREYHALARRGASGFAFEEPHPSLDVSLVIPIRNEIRHVDACVDSILGQRLDGLEMEVLLVDGASDDGTRERVMERAAADPRIRLLDNPNRKVSFALNIGMRASRGRVIVRMDAHALYADDYVRQCVAALERTGAAAVGGIQRAIPGADTTEARAIALAQHSRLGMGGGRHRRIGYEGPAESVWLGAFPRATVASVGGFDEDLFRSEDNDFFQRVRAHGGRLWVSAAIQARYYCRSTLRALFLQYYATGSEIVPTITRNRRALSLRHLAPGLGALVAILVVVVAALGPAPAAGVAAALAALAAVGYLGAVLLVALHEARPNGLRVVPWLLATFPVLHASYAIGTVVGALKTPGRIRRRRSRSESCGWSPLARVP